jgi:hypothetical protein
MFLSALLLIPALASPARAEGAHKYVGAEKCKKRQETGQ